MGYKNKYLKQKLTKIPNLGEKKICLREAFEDCLISKFCIKKKRTRKCMKYGRVDNVVRSYKMTKFLNLLVINIPDLNIIKTVQQDNTRDSCCCLKLAFSLQKRLLYFKNHKLEPIQQVQNIGHNVFQLSKTTQVTR